MKPQGLLAKASGAGFLKLPQETSEDNPAGQNLEDALQRKREKLGQTLDRKVNDYVPRTGGS